MTKSLFLSHRPLNNFASVMVSEEKGFRKEHPIDGKPSKHNGIDLVPAGDFKVFATHNGTVEKVAYQVNDEGKGWGNYVKIKSDDESGRSTLYAHLARLPSLKVGQKITAGTQIGIAGQTGGASGVHLHFEVIAADKTRLNPRYYLAEAFPEDFSKTVDAGALEGEVDGDYRANTLIASSRDNTLEGLAGTDTYEFKSLSNSGSDQIIDSDNDGIIKIAGEEISGNANPVVDSEKNIIPNQWTIKTEKGKAFQLSKDGTDLVIHQVNSDLLKSQTPRITITNFPFEKSQRSTGTDAPFGISLLGKTPDLTTDNSGNVVSETGYDRSTKSLPNLYSFNSNNFFKTADGKGFFGTISYGTLPVLNGGEDNLLSVANFNSYGEKTNQQQISEYPVLFYRQYSNNIFQYSDAATGENIYVLPFESDYTDDAGIKQTKVGFCVIDNSGQVTASKIIASAANDKSVSACSIIVSDTASDQSNFHFGYSVYKQGVGSYMLGQKVDRASLENVGDTFSISSLGYQPSNTNPTELYFENGNKITINRFSNYNYNSDLYLDLPKLRNLTSDETITSRVLGSGTQVAGSDFEKAVAVFQEGVETEMQVSVNPNSFMAFMGLNPKAKISIPMYQASSAKISAVDAGKYSVDDLLDGKYDTQDSSQRRLIQEEQIEGYTDVENSISSDTNYKPWQRALANNQTQFDSGFNSSSNSTVGDYYYYSGYYDADDYYNSTNVEVQETGNATHSVIALPNNQTLIVAGVNTTELVEYLSFGSQLTTEPSSEPTSDPSSQSSDQPSIIPSSKPSIQPSFRTQYPTNSATEFLSNYPSNIPSGIPSGIPTNSSNQVQIPSAKSDSSQQFPTIPFAAAGAGLVALVVGYFVRRFMGKKSAKPDVTEQNRQYLEVDRENNVGIEQSNISGNINQNDLGGENPARSTSTTAIKPIGYSKPVDQSQDLAKKEDNSISV